MTMPLKQQPGHHDIRQGTPKGTPSMPGVRNLQKPDLQRSLREQLERAASVQQSLLPDVSKPIGEFRLTSLYCPCESLGGDFLDLIRRPECVVLLVADVMGHGAEAALITMLVKAAFQETARTNQEPDSILAAMNARLHRKTPKGVYVAATVVRICAASPEMLLANAGLPYPFVLRCSQDQVEEVQVPGFPLGLFGGAASGAYPYRKLTLEPGDVLLLSSDGINSIDSLVSEAVDFSHGRPLPDDINLVAISRTGGSYSRTETALP